MRVIRINLGSSGDESNRCIHKIDAQQEQGVADGLEQVLKIHNNIFFIHGHNIAVGKVFCTIFPFFPYRYGCPNWYFRSFRRSTYGSERNVHVTFGNPNVTFGNPNVTFGNPNVTCGNPNVTSSNPNVTCGNPNVTSGNPNVTSDNPKVTCGNPNVTPGIL